MKIYLDIPPVYANNPLAAIDEYMADQVMTYFEAPGKKGGVLLAYNNVKLCEWTGRVMNDSPFSFTWVHVDTLLWRPQIGDVLGMETFKVEAANRGPRGTCKLAESEPRGPVGV